MPRSFWHRITAGFGEGHNAAARNLAVAFDSLLGPKTSQVADLYALASPRLSALGISQARRQWAAHSSFFP